MAGGAENRSYCDTFQGNSVQACAVLPHGKRTAKPMDCEISGFAEAWGELAAARNADAERKTEIMTETIENTENYMEEITAPTVQKLPLLAMRGIVLFPNMIMHFDLAREPFVKALRAGAKSDRRVFLVTQKDPLVEEPKQDDLYTVGVIAEVRQVLRSPDGVTRVLVEGKERAAITAAFLENTEKEKDFYPQAEVELLPEVSAEEDREKELAASVRCIKDIFQEYAELMPRMPKELMATVICEQDAAKMFNEIVFNLSLDYDAKQMLLEESSLLQRLEKLYRILADEMDILRLERKLQEETQENLDRSQREYYLREQMHLIAEQLGESEDPAAEMEQYTDIIDTLPLDEASRKKLEKEAERLSRLPAASQEAFVIRSYLDTVLALPWNKSSHTKPNLKRAQSVLEKDHYGLKKVKERILESIAVRTLLPEASGQILCFVGPPGVGKTSIGRSIAKALGRHYERVSLGGVRDESDIRGHRKTYVGAMPGRIMDAMTRAGTNNPMILLDEVDKMSNDFRGDPSAALLEVLDSEQNKAFRDHYIEVPFDLSKVLFVATANSLDPIPAPLLDRMEVIRLSGMNLIIDDTDHPLIIKVASIQSARMQVYFIDNDDYFQNRMQAMDENGIEYDDNDSRAIFYARGVLETVKKLRWCPDVIHCHGWMTALAPLYIKKAYKDEPSFRDAKVVFSVYEDDFKNTLSDDFATKLMLKGISKDDLSNLKEPVDYAALCKLAVDYSDGVIQNSKKVNESIIEYARQSGKLILDYQNPENYADACNEFYDQVWDATANKEEE